MFKKIAVVLLALWLLLCAALPVLAADTRIDTETPNWVSVALTIDGGKVRVNGSEYGNGEVVMIPYGSAAALEFISNNGKALKTVLLDGVDITALLTDGRYELSGLIHNAALTVHFNEESGTNTKPPDGNNSGSTNNDNNNNNNNNSGGSDGTTDITDPETPLAEDPAPPNDASGDDKNGETDSSTDIDTPDVPLATLPQTGIDRQTEIIIAIIGLFFAFSGIVFLFVSPKPKPKNTA